MLLLISFKNKVNNLTKYGMTNGIGEVPMQDNGNT